MCGSIACLPLDQSVYPAPYCFLQMKRIKADITPMPFHFPNTGKQVWEKKSVFFAEAQELERLNLSKVLGRLFDYVHCTSIRKVPERKLRGYAVYSRYQPEGLNPGKSETLCKKASGSNDRRGCPASARKEKICQTAVHTDEKPFPRRNI